MIFGQTDVGSVRAENQDAYRVGLLSQGVRYAVVCDGMGGAAGGSVASRLAADLIEERLKSGYRENMSEKSLLRMLETTIAAANALVYDEAMADADLRGMGTTAVVVVVRGDTVFTAHIGDSRIYLVNDDMIQLTTDHSVVQEMIEKGQLTPEEAKHHPRKNLITRAIGVDSRVTSDLQVLTVEATDGLLLCSDGLSNMVEPNEMMTIIRDTEIPAEIPSRLVDAANAAGGMDNITAVWIPPESDTEEDKG